MENHILDVPQRWFFGGICHLGCVSTRQCITSRWRVNSCHYLNGSSEPELLTLFSKYNNTSVMAEADFDQEWSQTTIFKRLGTNCTEAMDLLVMWVESGSSRHKQNEVLLLLLRKQLAVPSRLSRSPRHDLSD